MNIGKMCQRVTLQDFTTVRNEVGQQRPAWTDVATYFAEVVSLSGRELANAKQRKAEVSVMVRLRYGPTIRPSQRFLFGARTLPVLWVDNVNGRNVELQVFCEELLNPQ